MRRTIRIAILLAASGLAALAIWVFVKPRLGGGAGEGKDDRADITPPAEQVKPLAQFGMPVKVAFFGGDEFSPCFVDFDNKTLYRWKGVYLRGEQLRLTPYAGIPSGIRVIDAKALAFSVVPFEAAVRYLEVNGEFRPGYLDSTILAFYEWNGVVLGKKDLLETSADGQDPILKLDFSSRGSVQVLEIEMPAHLKDKPEVWKKKI